MATLEAITRIFTALDANPDGLSAREISRKITYAIKPIATLKATLANMVKEGLLEERFYQPHVGRPTVKYSIKR